MISSEERFSGQYNTETKVAGRMSKRCMACFFVENTIYSGWDFLIYKGGLWDKTGIYNDSIET